MYFCPYLDDMTYLKQGLYLPEFEHDNCGAGFICSLKGEKTNKIIHDALEILIKLEHRGAVSADGRTGDGAGILIDIPHEFFRKVCPFELPEENEYAVGMVFLPPSLNQYKYCIDVLEAEIKNQGLNLLGWREVPVDSSHLGKIAKKSEPRIMQVFVGKSDADMKERNFIAKVYTARKIAENKIIQSKLKDSKQFYLPSFSTTTLIYKGLLIPEDIRNYYTDLSDPSLVTRLALVHQRFSTNTAPSWDLAQPFRFMCHNGEINTLRGNVSRMRAREELMKSEIFGDQIQHRWIWWWNC
jgi:glutamate synthase (NADPH) large chain